MAGESFRFIHASDFHLETPLGDLDVLPAHLRESLALAPWKSAEAVFEAALAENIDFLVLSGDLLNPSTAGPFGISLLLRYFDELNKHETPVFWAAGSADDPQKWPEAVPLPPNVTLFPKGRVATVPVQRSGHTICMVAGRSGDGRSQLHVPSFRIDPTDEFTVAIGYGSATADALSEGRFDYWALGGEHQRKELEGGASAGAVYCGTPQGRNHEESGAHGYTIVDVDSDHHTRIHSIDCDVVRYETIRLSGSEIAAASDIRQLLGSRIGRLQHEHGSRTLLVRWEISVGDAESITAIGDPEDLVHWLRRDYGHGSPAAWTTSMHVAPPKRYPKNWTEEDTILGDFLRSAERFRASEARDLRLEAFTEEHADLPETTAAMLADVPSGDHLQRLDNAMLVGVDLLRGGKL